MSVVMFAGDRSGISAWKARWIYALVFLFPIAGVSVSHWYTTIFALLAFTALWDVFRSRERAPLLKDEKIWLICCVGFFGSFLLSALANGWDEGQTKSIEVDIRYLFAVPLYLMLRRFPEAGKYLLGGVALAAITLAVQSYYDMNILHLYRAQGFYSPNLLGPVAALAAVWILCSVSIWPRMKWGVPILLLAALYAVMMSGSRGAYLGLLAMALLWAALAVKRSWRMLMVGLVLSGAAGVYYESAYVKQRVDEATNETAIYVEADKPSDRIMGSAGARFELWQVGLRAFMESPVVGVGNKHFKIYAQKYVEAGQVNPAVLDHGHPHNAFLETLMSRGLIGFIFFAGMLCYPLYFFIKTHRQSPATALIGMTHVVGFIVFSLTDASTFIMGNFTSIFLLCMAIFMTWHVSRFQGAKN
ncbi:MAG: O-antigen ligase family protein [Gammaproteobacteria bacterium]|nr:O-antigen ligase family protein [Gammaproteobacteria bacterium]